MEPFDDIQCEESIPEYWEGSPEPDPLTEEELEDQFQRWQEENRIISEEDLEQAR
jgi:hypothetical protein